MLVVWGESVEARLSDPIPVVTASDFGEGCMASESLRRCARESSGRSPADDDEATVRFPRTGEGLPAPPSVNEGFRTGLAIGDVKEGLDPEVSLDWVVGIVSFPVSCASFSSESRCSVLGKAMLGSAMLGSAKDTVVGTRAVPPEREVPAIVGVWAGVGV